MSQAADLAALLAAEGQLESRGKFTLDREAARDKLQRFQLAEPARYVLLLVEAAVAQGATRIGVRIDANDVSFEFDGAPFDAKALDALWDVLLGDPLPEYPGLRPLALALNAAMGLSPRFVRVVSGPAKAGHRLELDGRGAPRQQARDDHKGGTRIHVRERLSLRTVSEFWRNLNSARDEELLLTKHCAYVATPIEVNGDIISRGPPKRIGCASRRVEFEGATIIAGLAPAFVERAQIERCRRGVRVDVISAPHYPGPVIVFIEDPAFALDLSQAGIRRDDHYARVMKRADKLVFEMLHEVVAEGIRVSGLVPGLSQWPIEHFRELYRRSVRCALEAGSLDAHPFAEPLFDVPFFETLAGEPRSLRQVQARIRDAGWAGAATRRPEETLPNHDRDTLWLPVDADRKLLRDAFPGALRSRDAVLSRSDRRAQNKRRWERMRKRPRLGEGYWEQRRVIDHGAIRGEIGLGPGESRVDLIYEGGVIRSFDPQLDIQGLHAVVEAPFSPAKTFDDVHKDQTLVRVLLLILRHVPDLLLQADGMAARRDPSARLLRLIEHVITEDYGPRLFEAAGFSSNATEKRLRTRSAKRAIPCLDPRADAPHDLVDLPLLPALSGKRMSLREVAELLHEQGHILWAPRKRRIAVHHTELPTLLLIDAKGEQTVRFVFGAGAMREAEKVIARAEARARFLERKPDIADAERELANDVFYLAQGSVDAGELRGTFAVSPISLHTYWGDEASEHLADLQVYVAGRKIMDQRSASPLPGVLGVVDLPLRLLGDDFESLKSIAAKRIDALVKAYAEHALTHVLDPGAIDVTSAEGQGLLRALVTWGRPSREELTRDPWLTITQHIYLLAIDGRGVPLADVLSAAADRGKVHFATPEPGLADVAEGMVLGSDRFALSFVERVAKCPSQDLTRELRQRKLASALRAQGPAEPMALRRPVVHEVDFVIRAAGREFRGHAGIPTTLPQSDGPQVTLHVDGRAIETLRADDPAVGRRVPLEVAIDGPFHLAAINRVSRDDLFLQATEGITGAYAGLMAALIEHAQGPDAPNFEHSRAWIWALGATGAHKGIDAAARERLRELPLLRHHVKGSAKWVSAQALGEHFAQADGMPCYDTRSPGDNRPEDFVDLPPEQIAVTRSMFSIRLVDRTRTWHRRAAWLAQQPTIAQDFRAQVPPHPFVLKRTEIDGDELTVWIDELDEGACVCVCDGTHVLATRKPYPSLRIGGVIRLRAERCAWLDAPPETPDLDVELMLLTLELLREASDAVQMPDASPEFRARMDALRRRIGETEDWDLGQIRAALDRAALIRDGDTWISPEASERKERFDIRARAEAERRAEEQAAVAAAVEARRVALEQLTALSGGSDEREPAAVATQDEVRIELPPELVLLEQIRSEIRLARSETEGAYGDAQLESIGLRAGRGRLAVDIDDEGCFLDAKNALVRAACAADPPPALITLLASIAASTLNTWLDKVTETHELELVLHLTQRAKLG